MIKILTINKDKHILHSIATNIRSNYPNAQLLNSDNAEEGIELAKINDPDIILLFSGKKRKEDLQLCKTLKKDKSANAIPILLIPGKNDNNETISDILSAGADGILVHANDANELKSQIDLMFKIKKINENEKSSHLITEELTEKINEQTTTLAKLKEKENILNQAQEIANLGSWEFDVTTNKMSWSENAFNIFGFKPYEIIPTLPLLTDILLEEDRHLLSNAFESLKETKKPQSIEFRLLRKDTHIKWLQCNLIAIFNNNKLQLIRGIIIDITRRKETEKKLNNALYTAKEQDKFSRVSAEISTELIDVTLENINNKIQYALEKIGKYSGAARSFIFLMKENSSMMDNTHEWCNSKVKSNIEQLKDIRVENSSWWINSLHQKKEVYINDVFKEEEFLVRDKRSLKELEIKSVILVPILKGNEFLGFMGLNSSGKEKSWDDFHVQIIKAISNSIASALYSVRNQNQLLIAKEKAEESDRLKSAFLANMSHEIRTPMNGIMGFLDLIHSTHISKKEQNLYFDMVKASGERLLATINDIIEIAKIESGQTPVIKSKENVNEILDYLYSIYAPLAEEKGLEFRFSENAKKYRNEIVAIKTDKIKLEVILKNLIRNAIKFTREGEVEVGYEILEKEIVFTVKDTGPGIDTMRQEAIFDRFVQADLDINRSYEGAGLGLSITLAYTEMLDGKIWVESEIGKGSTFFLSLNHNALML